MGDQLYLHRRLLGDIKHFKLYGHATISSTYKTGGVPADCSKCALGLRSPTKPASSHDLTLIGHLLISPSKPSTLLSVLTILDLQPWWLIRQPLAPRPDLSGRRPFLRLFSSSAPRPWSPMPTSLRRLKSVLHCTSLYTDGTSSYYTQPKMIEEKTWKSRACSNWSCGKTPKTYNHRMENIC